MAANKLTGQCWQTVFAFWIIGSVFLVWMMVMAGQVNSNQYRS
jgi:formate/nitrite transporter FocA (FNT family)